MIKYLLIICFIFLSKEFIYSQTLTISETTDYINKLVKGKMSIKQDGEVRLEFQDNRRTAIYIQGIIYNINDIYFVEYKNDKYGEYGIKIKCKENFSCLKCYKKDGTINDSFIKPRIEKECGLYGVNDTSEKSTIKLKNALEYLKDIGIKEGFRKEDDIYDPFSSDNYISASTKVITKVENENIKLQKSGSLYYINIALNGHAAKFILDSGASDVTINTELEKILINKNLIKKEDYLSPALYKIADGSVSENRRFLIRNLKIGNFTVQNITAAVANDGAPLLLGKSLLDNFSSWSIDNQNMTLRLHR